MGGQSKRNVLRPRLKEERLQASIRESVVNGAGKLESRGWSGGKARLRKDSGRLFQSSGAYAEKALDQGFPNCGSRPTSGSREAFRWVAKCAREF